MNHRYYAWSGVSGEGVSGPHLISALETPFAANYFMHILHLTLAMPLFGFTTKYATSANHHLTY